MESIGEGRLGSYPGSFAQPDLEDFMNANATPMFHLSGTCRMGSENDPMAVVDPQFRINGLRRLRVVDASVMPDLIGGNPVACVMMLAEMAADQIRANNGRAST
jgi:choline dehydrogenase-like flavoprotein